MGADVERVRIEPGRVERLHWGVQVRATHPGAAWCLATVMWRGEVAADGCWPPYLLFRTRHAARICVQHLRRVYAPDEDAGHPPRRRFKFREVRVRERISVVA